MVISIKSTHINTDLLAVFKEAGEHVANDSQR